MTHYTRRQAVQIFPGGLLSGAVLRRPNIIFILTDDHAYGELSCYGSRILKTPNMDRLATEGARFDNCFVTNSLCAPSRATILTGAYSHINGVRGNSEDPRKAEHLNPRVPTFPQLLQKAGYRTGIVGKWHLSDDPVGFDTWRVLPGQGVYNDPEFIEQGTVRRYSGYVTDITTDMALEFLESAGDGPFCLLYQHKAPHRPFTPAPRHMGLFRDIEIPHPKTYDDDYATRRIAGQAVDMRFDVSLAGDYPDLPAGLSQREKKNWIFQRFVKDHHRAVVGVDEGIGRVLDYLDRHKLTEDTMVIYTTDNGFFLGEHGWYDKRFMYEPSLRVPLLIRYPRMVRSATLASAMALNLDLAPTILNIAGLPVPGTMQGRSLSPILQGKTPPDWRQSIYYTYYENSWAESKAPGATPRSQLLTPHRVVPHRGVRTDRHKLIQYYGEGDYWELFDLKTDPDELNNIYGDPRSARVVADLKRELNRLRRQFKDL